MSIRPYVTAGFVIAGASVLLTNPPGPAEPTTVQRVVNPLVATVAAFSVAAVPAESAVKEAPAGQGRPGAAAVQVARAATGEALQTRAVRAVSVETAAQVVPAAPAGRVAPEAPVVAAG